VHRPTIVLYLITPTYLCSKSININNIVEV
jgi:hypothetical protein